MGKGIGGAATPEKNPPNHAYMEILLTGRGGIFRMGGMLLSDVVIPIVEISVIATVLNYLLYYFKKSVGLLIGFGAAFSLFVMSSVCGLPVLYTITTHFMGIAAIGLIVIFQPELRAALSKLSLKGKVYQEESDFDKFVEQLVHSIYSLANHSAGALIVLQNGDNLDDFIQKGIRLDARFSPELLETIFSPLSPLHDGAVVINHKTIVAASVVLPLADDTSALNRPAGTRHLAALGFSQRTDALVIAISEQTQKVFHAREGMPAFDVLPHQLQGVIHSLYEKHFKEEKQKKFHRLRLWIKGS